MFSSAENMIKIWLKKTQIFWCRIRRHIGQLKPSRCDKNRECLIKKKYFKKSRKEVTLVI